MKKTNELLGVTWIAVLLAIFCQAFWASAFSLIKKAYECFNIVTVEDAYMLAAARFILAGIMLLSLCFIKEKKFPKPAKDEIGRVFLVATIQSCLMYIFQFAALIRVSSVSASVINGMSVAVTNVIAHFLFVDDRLNIKKVLSSVLAFAGIMVIALNGDKLSGNFSFFGEGFLILSIFCSCLGCNLNRKLIKKTNSAVTTAYILLISGLELALIASVLGGRLENGGRYGFEILFCLSFISCFCFMLWTALVRVNKIGKISACQCANPIAGAILAGVILGENFLQFRYIFSLFLMTLSILISTWQREVKYEK